MMTESDHKKAYHARIEVRIRTVVIYFAIKNRYVFYSLGHCAHGENRFRLAFFSDSGSSIEDRRSIATK